MIYDTGHRTSLFFFITKASAAVTFRCSLCSPAVALRSWSGPVGLRWVLLATKQQRGQIMVFVEKGGVTVVAFGETVFTVFTFLVFTGNDEQRTNTFDAATGCCAHSKPEAAFVEKLASS